MSSPACCSPEKSMEKNAHDAQNADNARKNTAFPPVCKKCAKVCRTPENGKSHEESCDSSWDFGALEGTRIPGPLIKSQMLYRLSYERIHYKAQYNTILPNNITILPAKSKLLHKKLSQSRHRADFATNCPFTNWARTSTIKAVHYKTATDLPAHFRAGQADPIGGLFP